MNINQAEKTVFIDESGNNGFDFSKVNVSTHFITTAIILDTDKLESIRFQANAIREKFFPNGEIKSSHCPDMGKRFKVLSELTKLDIMIVAVVIDKKYIFDNSPIKNYKDIFFKYLNKLLHIELKIFNCDLAIYADKHGNQEFMESFSNYIQKQFPSSLIDNNTFKFVDSKEEVLIQVSDFIAGTISYGYEESKKCKEFKGLFALIDTKKPIIRLWPAINIPESLEIIETDKFDRIIARNCITLASNYIETNQMSNDELYIDQLIVLKYLINHVYLHPTDYVFIDELRNHISMKANREYNRRIFQKKVIANMRDSGVIISSSSQGVKIPITSKELYAYTEQTLGTAIPMLERLEKARRRILAITNNELDIVDSQKYKRIIDYMDNKL